MPCLKAMHTSRQNWFHNLSQVSLPSKCNLLTFRSWELYFASVPTCTLTREQRVMPYALTSVTRACRIPSKMQDTRVRYVIYHQSPGTQLTGRSWEQFLEFRAKPQASEFVQLHLETSWYLVALVEDPVYKSHPEPSPLFGTIILCSSIFITF